MKQAFHCLLLQLFSVISNIFSSCFQRRRGRVSSKPRPTKPVQKFCHVTFFNVAGWSNGCALDLRYEGRRFDCRPFRLQVTNYFRHVHLTLVKLGLMPRGWEGNRRSGVALIIVPQSRPMGNPSAGSRSKKGTLPSTLHVLYKR